MTFRNTRLVLAVVAVLAISALVGCGGGSSNGGTTPPPPPPRLTVTLFGTGTGTGTSAPAGISCGSTCSAGVPSGTVVHLSPAPAAGSAFQGWAGDCSCPGRVS